MLFLYVNSGPETPNWKERISLINLKWFQYETYYYYIFSCALLQKKPFFRYRYIKVPSGKKPGFRKRAGP